MVDDLVWHLFWQCQVRSFQHVSASLDCSCFPIGVQNAPNVQCRSSARCGWIQTRACNVQKQKVQYKTHELTDTSCKILHGAISWNHSLTDMMAAWTVSWYRHGRQHPGGSCFGWQEPELDFHEIWVAFWEKCVKVKVGWCKRCTVYMVQGDWCESYSVILLQKLPGAGVKGVWLMCNVSGVYATRISKGNTMQRSTRGIKQCFYWLYITLHSYWPYFTLYVDPWPGRVAWECWPTYVVYIYIIWIIHYMCAKCDAFVLSKFIKAEKGGRGRERKKQLVYHYHNDVFLGFWTMEFPNPQCSHASSVFPQANS